MLREDVQRRIHPRIDLVRIRKAISQAKSLDELLTLAVMLSHETEALLNDRTLNERDIHLIVVPLAQIRFLLTTMAPVEHGSGKVRTEDPHIRGLIDRYRDIEGRLKEMRNDLAAASKASLS